MTNKIIKIDTYSVIIIIIKQNKTNQLHYVGNLVIVNDATKDNHNTITYIQIIL